MKDRNQYKKYFAIKRAIKVGKEFFHNDRKVEKIDLSELLTLAGTSYVAIWYEDQPDSIYADLIGIQIV
jgi:hypothetical protein